MRVLVLSYSDRPRPVLVTPAKGAIGDCTDETQACHTDIGSIIARYGGNLAELARWRGTMSFGDQPVSNLEDALEVLASADEALGNIPNKPFSSLDEALASFRDGTFYEKLKGEKLKGEEHEEKPNQQEEKPEDLPQNGQPSAS